MQLLAHLTEFDSLFVAGVYCLGFVSGSVVTWFLVSRRQRVR